MVQYTQCQTLCLSLCSGMECLNFSLVKIDFWRFRSSLKIPIWGEKIPIMVKKIPIDRKLMKICPVSPSLAKMCSSEHQKPLLGTMAEKCKTNSRTFVSISGLIPFIIIVAFLHSHTALCNPFLYPPNIKCVQGGLSSQKLSMATTGNCVRWRQNRFDNKDV